MRRREFLKLGSAGVAAFALPDVNLFSLHMSSVGAHPANVAAAGLPRLAVAYCEHTPTAAAVTHTAAVDRSAMREARLRPAEHLRVGDARLARDGAQLTLRGVVPDGSTLTAARVLLDFQPFHTTPFQAWSYAAGSVSKATTFRAAIDAASGMNLWVDVQHAGEATPRTTVLRFAIGGDADTPKLRAGTYVIALEGAAGAWREYRVASQTQRVLGLYRVSGGRSVPANQAHLLLTVS